MTVDLKDRIAVVTGSGGAIGREIALTFARNGADIVVNDIAEDAGQRVVREIESLGRRALFVRADVGDPEQMRSMAEEVRRVFGRLDILVNNAGINVGPEDRKPVHQFSEENWRRIVNTDLNGIFYCSRPIVERMIERKGGKIVNIASIVGLVPLRLQCAFAAAKAGVINLTRAMALELAPHGINVNAIAPGSILMEGTKQLFYNDPAKTEDLLSHIPLHRPGTPADVANAALFLVADEASYLTGSVLVVDGGWTCGYARAW